MTGPVRELPGDAAGFWRLVALGVAPQFRGPLRGLGFKPGSKQNGNWSRSYAVGYDGAMISAALSFLDESGIRLCWLPEAATSRSSRIWNKTSGGPRRKPSFGLVDFGVHKKSVSGPYGSRRRIRQ